MIFVLRKNIQSYDAIKHLAYNHKTRKVMINLFMIKTHKPSFKSQNQENYDKSFHDKIMNLV